MKDDCKVLIVDDEKSVRKAFNTILTMAFPDITVDLAANGIEAFKHFLTSHHDIVLMDLHMPMMDGEGAFNEIKSICEREKKEMPSVIFCTAYDPSDTVRKIIDGDPRHAILTKPINSEGLINAVRERA